MTGRIDKSMADIAQDLRSLVDAMLDSATDLDYYGGSDPTTKGASKNMITLSAIVLEIAKMVSKQKEAHA